jgi:uncharacterized membrane protein YeaQ/YmgE (transglycosylase-associated protein family)
MESWLVWIVLGLIAGATASALMGRRGAGCISNIILGLLGAVVGGFLVNRFVDPNFSFQSASFCPSVLVAVLGAIVLIFLARLFSGRGRY